MSKRKVYHVTPDGKGGWNVITEGAQKSSAHFEKKEEAIDRGKQLAIRSLSCLFHKKKPLETREFVLIKA